VVAAKAEVRRAQSQLDLLAVGARPESVAAEAALAQAKVALAEMELKASFAGTGAALDARLGEQVGPGSPVVHLADLSAWQIEIDVLTELNAVRVAEGAPATITFDAIPGLKVTGKVSRIKPLGENKQGDMTYVVIVAPDQVDPRLRWNMTASVAIEPR